MIKKKINSNNEGYTLYEYVFNTENEQLSYPYSEIEEPISFSTGVDKKYYTIVKKWNNFFSKIQAITNKTKTSYSFIRNHRDLANKIQEAAEDGRNYCLYPLHSEQIRDLRAEGFTLDNTNFYWDQAWRISW